MSIILNGGSNPSAVTYNGTSLTKVIYNGTTVWEKSTHPTPGIVTIASGDFKVWLRDLEYDLMRQRVWSGGVLYYQHEYHGNCTVEIPLEKGKYLNVTNLGQTWTLFSKSISASEVSGLPSGCKLNSFYLPSSATVGLGCYALSSGGGIGNRVKTYGFKNYDNKILAVDSYARLIVSDECDGTYAVYNDLIDKWIYQGAVPRVCIYEPVS